MFSLDENGRAKSDQRSDFNVGVFVKGFHGKNVARNETGRALTRPMAPSNERCIDLPPSRSKVRGVERSEFWQSSFNERGLRNFIHCRESLLREGEYPLEPNELPHFERKLYEE